MLNRFSLYLFLARASNLPTVWTNAVAAWAVVGGSFQWGPLIWLSLAGSLLYAGGCTLNDAFDAKWDAERRPERPIPSGKLSAQEVWLVGQTELGLGLALLAAFGLATLLSGMLVVVAIVLYDWLHKKSPWAVLLMAWCRLQWVITVGIAAGATDLEQSSISYGILLFGYIVLISVVARLESLNTARAKPSLKTTLAHWFVLISVLFFGTRHNPEHWPAARIPFYAFISFYQTALQMGLRSTPPNIGRFVGLALAGITLLDTVFACLVWSWSGLWLALMLPLCLLLQRRIAAT
jgi:4-hydroxybenzoate polyprenyltransferase